VSTVAESGAPAAAQLERGIDWTGAFWVASGVPPLVLFSIGGVAISGCANVPVTDTEPQGADPDNIATCSYTPTAADATAGSVTIEAAYSGDDYALKSSDTEILTVSP